MLAMVSINRKAINLDLLELRNKLASDLSSVGNIKPTLDLLFAEIENRDRFSPTDFYDWFSDKDVPTMNYPLRFLEKCALADIKDGKFDKPLQNASIDVSPIIDDMKAKGFEVNPDDVFTIVLFEDWAYNSAQVDIDTLCLLNRRIMDYIVENDMKSTSRFIEMFSRSKLAKTKNMPVKELVEKSKKLCKEWNEMLEQLDPPTQIQITGETK